MLISFFRGNYGHTEIHRERQLMPRGFAAVNGPTDWNEALEIISSEDPDQVCKLKCFSCHL